MTRILKKLSARTTPALYTDFDVSFEPHPITGDLPLVTDEAAIRQSLRNIIMTMYNERLMRPGFGSDLMAEMFQLLTPVSLRIIREKVVAAIQNFEPRIEIVKVEVFGIEHTIRVDITYFIRNQEDQVTTSIFIERTR